MATKKNKLFSNLNKFSKQSWAVTAILLLLGFLFLFFKIVDYGITFFILFPMAIGYSIGTMDKRERRVSYLILGLLIFFGFLLAGALEGLICVLMALPIFALCIFFGYKAQQYRKQKEDKASNRLLMSLFPLLVLLALNPIEQGLLPEPRLITIQNSIVLNYPPEIVFDEVKQMDKLDAEKPLGMWLGLPAPYKCDLEADSIGAKRVCLFKEGKIVAQITAYEKGKVLQMDVLEYTLTGKDWFEFVDASYTFEKTAEGKTLISRTSSYKSILHPRFYWQPIERWGIEQEHKFVLNSLKKNIQEKYDE